MLHAADRLRFEEFTDAVGVRFEYRNGEEAAQFAILESLGGGVGLCDYDADGDIDVFAPGGGEFTDHNVTRGRPSGLLRNRAAWRFDDVSAPSGANLQEHYSHGAAAADFDEDGFTDLLVTGYGGLTLLQNRGDGTFDNVAQYSGLNDTSWSSSAAWGDLDQDGAVDLYVTHYVDWAFDNNPECRTADGAERDVCPPWRFQPLPDAVYFSNNDGSFRDGSGSAGLRADGKGLGVIVADLDLDGRLDVYVANDTVPNFLYLGLGRGRFADESLLSGTAMNEFGKPDGSMGLALLDFDLDAKPDIWVTNYQQEVFALYRNLGQGLFRHSSRQTGIAELSDELVGWGTVALDADCDGDEDLCVVCGHVVLHPVDSTVLQRPLLLQNRAGERFDNVAASAGPFFSNVHRGRGVAGGDLDADGDIDLVVSRVNAPLAFLSNETKSDGHWLSVRLIGRSSNRSAVGAVAWIRSGGRVWIRQVIGGGSYASGQCVPLFFGLADHNQIDELEIRWPSGIRQVLRNPQSDEQVTIVESAHQ